MPYLIDEQACKNPEVSTRREWILTNRLGGFSMGTVSGINTRRYHGLLVAATSPPETRMVLLGAIDAFVQTDSSPIGLSANQYPGAIFPQGYLYLSAFSIDGTAIWSYRGAGFAVDRRITMHEGKNAVTIEYVNVGADPVLLTLRPLVCHKFYHANFTEHQGYPQSLSFPKNSTVIENDGVTLFLDHPTAQRSPVQGWYYRFDHARETERGLDARDDLFCPCELKYELLAGESAVIVASTEAKTKPVPSAPQEHAEGFRLQPLLEAAADHFFVETKSRSTIIAGYPWFTDWGRDTMISLPGILLHTGRVAKARSILDDYASQMFQGLIPNRFVEQGQHPDYNTVDATLWFANSIYKTLDKEWDEGFATRMHKVLTDVFEWHVKGTLFGIRVDPEDGLLTQGQEGVQLTWMDAKVGDWVVTPRHGKPVEINGLWINALRVVEWLAEKLEKDVTAFRAAAEKAESNFEAKFWNEHLGFYLDTADPNDASLRPNQCIAMALPFMPVNGDRAKRALQVVARELLTPIGLRTLGPSEPGYRGRYQGPLPEMDAAYHQGTAWPWLLGSYVTAMVKVTKDKKEAKRLLKNARLMLTACGISGISEVYDGDPPQNPNGCPWQAWSAAEILRAWVEDCGGD
jgi:predicted glycogen debranching enzyme